MRKPAGAPWECPGRPADHYQVWIDDWQASLEGEAHHLQAAADKVALDLHLTPEKPPVLHGENGISQKAAGLGNASHYYSLTRLGTAGKLTYQDRTFHVQGISWMDHEFSSSQLAPYQAGWDWFSLQLDDGHDLMIYVLRHQDGSPDPFSSGTLVDPAGKKSAPAAGRFCHSTFSKLEIPPLRHCLPRGLEDKSAARWV